MKLIRTAPGTYATAGGEYTVRRTAQGGRMCAAEWEVMSTEDGYSERHAALWIIQNILDHVS